MNRIFKVVWNKSKGCYTVASEKVKGITKSASNSSEGTKILTALVCLTLLTGGLPVQHQL